MGAYFEKLDSKSFAVYSIALQMQITKLGLSREDIEILSDYIGILKIFLTIHCTCLPNKYFRQAQRMLLFTNVAFSLTNICRSYYQLQMLPSSISMGFFKCFLKELFFWKISPTMRTLAVNVDDAVDDIVRQFKGVSDGFMRKVVGSTSPSDKACASSNYDQKLSFNSNELRKHVSAQHYLEEANNMSDEEGERLGSENHEKVRGWHSDTELNSKSFPPRVIKRGEESDNLVVDKKNDLELRSGASDGGFSQTSYHMEDPEGMPPEGRAKDMLD
ncbi:uncharacterized protein LOC111007888 [Momordica charantia]|uniref:Uncharacterized protein LOC111007888 n=1 Tax=Momordica charantia TaxID=3673 RepID=A0A6J1C4N8_MOMCH|nr:uncharacterized protein LOC111007888 [Momordica charantia]